MALSKISENVSNLHDFHNSTLPLTTATDGIMLLLGIIFDIAAVAIAIFHLKILIKTDQTNALVNLLREEFRSFKILPSWKVTGSEPNLDPLSCNSKEPPTSCAELSSETNNIGNSRPLPDVIRNSRRSHKTTPFKISIENAAYPTVHESVKKISRPRIPRAPSSVCHESSQSSVCFSASHQNLFDSRFIMRQREKLCAKKDLPDAIKKWLTENNGGFKNEGSRCSYSEKSENRRSSSKLSSEIKGYSNTNLNSFHFKSIDEIDADNFESREPLEIERLNSHEKVRNYLSELKVPPTSMEKFNSGRSSKMKLPQNSADGVFNSNKVKLRQSEIKPLPRRKSQRKQSSPNLNQSRSNKNLNERHGKEPRRVESGTDFENASLTDFQSSITSLHHAAPSPSDLTYVSIDAEFISNNKSPTKFRVTPVTGSHKQQQINISREPERSLSCDRKTTRKYDKQADTCTETFSSNNPDTNPPEAVERLNFSRKKIIRETSSSDSLGSETSVTDDRSPEKFASETNSLWQMMTDAPQ